jgi:hypothetical protein
VKAYQEEWLESLQEYTDTWCKPNIENNVLGICCKIIGDDTGETDLLTKELARILQRFLIVRMIIDSDITPRGEK